MNRPALRVIYEAHADELRRALLEPTPVRTLFGIDEVYLQGVFERLGESAEPPRFSIERFLPHVDRATEVGRGPGKAPEAASSLDERLRVLVSEVHNRDATEPYVLWLRDSSSLSVHHEGQLSPQRLLEFGRRATMAGGPYRVVLGGAEVPMSATVASYVRPIELSRPSVEHLRGFLGRLGHELGCSLDQGVVGLLAELLRGFAAWTVARIIRDALSPGQLPAQQVEAVRQRRDAELRRSDLLQVEPTEQTLDDLGGLEGFKAWLEEKTEIVMCQKEAAEAGVAPPKGVLIAGVPGCGKSLAAKIVATQLGVPLLRLDVGRVLGKHLGESEANLRSAIALAEAAAPCVLWLDEIEKALGSPSQKEGAHEVTVRLIGFLLTWLQERRDSARGVLVIATANAVKNLPPELLRKGRFDELFYFGLPTKEERRQILQLVLERIDARRPPGTTHRWSEGSGDLLDDWADDAPTRHYSGADIEALVEGAVTEAWLEGHTKLSHEHLERVSETIKPYGKSHEKIAELKKELMNQHGFRDASASGERPRRERRGYGQLSALLKALVRRGPPLALDFKTQKGTACSLVLSPNRFRASVDENGRSETYRLIPAPPNRLLLEPLFSGRPLEISTADFDGLQIGRQGDVPVPIRWKWPHAFRVATPSGAELKLGVFRLKGLAIARIEVSARQVFWVLLEQAYKSGLKTPNGAFWGMSDPNDPVWADVWRVAGIKHPRKFSLDLASPKPVMTIDGDEVPLIARN